MELDEVRSGLLAQAWLFDDPYAYVAGVEDALSAMWPLLESTGPRSA